MDLKCRYKLLLPCANGYSIFHQCLNSFISLASIPTHNAGFKLEERFKLTGTRIAEGPSFPMYIYRSTDVMRHSCYVCPCYLEMQWVTMRKGPSLCWYPDFGVPSPERLNLPHHSRLFRKPAKLFCSQELSLVLEFFWTSSVFLVVFLLLLNYCCRLLLFGTVGISLNGALQAKQARSLLQVV